MLPSHIKNENVFEYTLNFLSAFDVIVDTEYLKFFELHYIFYPTFIRGNKEKSVMLFIKEVPNKENFVSIIDPQEGNKKEINIEELAKQLNCKQKDDVFTLIDPNKVDQIIFICFDESQSMKWKLDGGNPHHDEKTRSSIATDFFENSC